MALFQPDDGLLLVVVWSASQAVQRAPVIAKIAGCDTTIAITGDDVPQADPIKIQAGAAGWISWTYNGSISLVGKALTFRAKDMVVGAIIFAKSNALAGGSDDDFVLPDLDSDGLPQLDADGKRLPALIRVHGPDTSGARIDVHKYVVEMVDPADTIDPTLPSDGTFQITDHA